MIKIIILSEELAASEILVIFTISAVPWLKQLDAGLSPWRPGFTPRSVHMVFVVGKVALGQIFLQVLQFSSASVIPPLLHNHFSPPHEV
jgi:hypothetical protein